MKEKLGKIVSNVYHGLVSWGESCPLPGYLDHYYQGLPKAPFYAGSKSPADDWKMALTASKVKAERVELAETPELPDKVAGDEVLVAK